MKMETKKSFVHFPFLKGLSQSVWQLTYMAHVTAFLHGKPDNQRKKKARSRNETKSVQNKSIIGAKECKGVLSVHNKLYIAPN